MISPIVGREIFLVIFLSYQQRKLLPLEVELLVAIMYGLYNSTLASSCSDLSLTTPRSSRGLFSPSSSSIPSNPIICYFLTWYTTCKDTRTHQSCNYLSSHSCHQSCCEPVLVSSASSIPTVVFIFSSSRSCPSSVSYHLLQHLHHHQSLYHYHDHYPCLQPDGRPKVD